MSKTNRYIIFSALLYFAGAVIQFISLVLRQENTIGAQSETDYLFLSLLPAAAADYLITRAIPDKYKIPKYIILFHAAGAVTGNIIYWIIRII